MPDPTRGHVATDLVALPVAVDGPRHLVEQVGSWVESHLGWQVTTGESLPAALRLVGVTTSTEDDPIGPGPSARGRDPSAAPPAIALVGPDDDPVAATRLARDVDAVLAWPHDHDRLAGLADRLLERRPRPEATGLRVGGAAGGVGSTTVALALGALVAWSGRGCLVVARGDVPVPRVRRVEPEVLAGHRAWAAAVEVPDVAGLRVVAVDGPALLVKPPPGVPVVDDRGVDGEVDALVVRRDRVGVAAIERSGAALVVEVGIGPRTPDVVARAADGRALVRLPWSVRVARLHDAERIPGALPGAYLAGLRAAVDLVDG